MAALRANDHVVAAYSRHRAMLPAHERSSHPATVWSPGSSGYSGSIPAERHDWGTVCRRSPGRRKRFASSAFAPISKGSIASISLPPIQPSSLER